jgi:tRNA (guanine-N7-)-methyltransferase
MTDDITAGLKLRRPRLASSKNFNAPTEYVKMLQGEYADSAFDEDRAPQFKGAWRKEAFKVSESHPLDLEIGTGNGYHFAHLASAHPDRSVLGIELKFKPLIQSIRRARRAGSKNALICRYDARRVDHLFQAEELNNVYIHFPDPWGKKRHWKNRLIQTDFLILLHALMKPGSFLDFKTDNLDYFEWAIERFHASPFKVTRETRDLHTSEWKDQNFVTGFEAIFLSQGMKINYARMEKR